ncbi:DNA primase [Candidatus Phytoplasma australiense]|uniref:DNA primase n=1 Tax=Phytoplasma australiense TaxID=59748 RepID=B1VAH5_PHYAS|nr:DNA primase [Candidatus Phytoplasma australiense]
MQKQLIQEINEKTSIVELAQEFVQLKKSGKNYMGLCPFHDEKTPSFSVSPEKNIAVCMSCKKGGNPVFFYQNIKNISFREAVAQLGARLGIASLSFDSKKDKHAHLYEIMKEATEFFQIQLKHNEKALQYLKTRGLDEKIITHFKLGYAPNWSYLSRYLTEETKFEYCDLKALSLVNQNEQTGKFYDFFQNRLIFPITNLNGQIIAFSSRSLTDQIPKYLNSPETVLFKKGEVLYQYFENQAEIRKKETIILHEGFFDVISSFKVGVKNVVATMGTNLTQNHLKLLSKLAQKIIIAYDGDASGKKSALSIGNTLQQKNFDVKILDFPNNLDPDEYIKTEGAEKYHQLLTNHLTDFLTLQIDLICKKISWNNRKKIEKELKMLFQNQDLATKTVYQSYLAQKYQLFIDFNVQQQELIIPTLISSQNTINYKKFDKEIHILIEFINNRSFFEKNYQINNDALVYSDVNVSYFIEEIKTYYQNNLLKNSIPWNHLEKNDNESLHPLIEEIKNHHFFQAKISLDQNTFEKYIQDFKNAKTIQELKEEINKLRINIKMHEDLKEKTQYLYQLSDLQKKLKKLLEKIN